MTAAYPDRIPCRVCGGTAYDLSDALPFPPCSHGEPLCGDCNLGVDGCLDCKLEAEREMHDSGTYDPAADPFYRPEGEGSDAAYWASAPREVPGVAGVFRRMTDKQHAELERLRETDREAWLRCWQALDGKAKGEG